MKFIFNLIDNSIFMLSYNVLKHLNNNANIFSICAFIDSYF